MENNNTDNNMFVDESYYKEIENKSSENSDKIEISEAPGNPGESSEVAAQSDDGSSGITLKGFLKDLAIDLVIAVILASIALCFIRPTVVRQTSMENTLHDGDYMIMYKLAYHSHGPERGDIIIFSHYEEEDGEKLLIKRVIGLPGDEIEITDDQLYINGEAYDEDYLKDGYTPAFEIPEEGETFTVPDEEYFVMGDNRVGSYDSRYEGVGCVDPEDIKGKVVLRLFPLKSIHRY